MSEHLPEPGELARALRSLVPVPAPLDRDRLLFRAGQVSRGRGKWLWPASSGVLAATVLVLVVLLVQRPAVQTTIRTVYVEVPVPAPQVPAVQPVPLPHAVEPESSSPVETTDPPDLAYYRLQKQVATLGVDALPPMPANPGPAANDPPLTVFRLSGRVIFRCRDAALLERLALSELRRTSNMVRRFAAIGLLLLLCSAGRSQEVRVVRLVLSPAGAPTPAMKYKLLPEVGDLKPGNAALFYQRAHSPDWIDHVRRQPNYQKASDWLELPLDKMPLPEVRGILPTGALREVDYAARRESCDWEMIERLRQDGIGLLIPDVQSFREFGMLLALRARVELREKDFRKATYTLETGFALARHVGDSCTLISGLVGIAVSSILCDQIEQLVQLPESPNLFWALTDLPLPFIDLRRAMQAEKLMVEAHLPEIRQALGERRPAPLSAQKVRERVDLLRGLEGGTGRHSNWDSVAVAFLAAKVYPRAVKFLRARGVAAEDVEALPVIQVAFMYALAEYDRHYDNMYKWQNLPYWQAQPGLLQADRELKESKAALMSRGGIPLAELLIPATQKVLLARTRLDRRIAALRCVEAIRLYAAGHNGKLPESLAAITDLPLPLDPLTGKSFEYRLDQGGAVLSGPPPGGETPSVQNSFRYELSLRP